MKTAYASWRPAYLSDTYWLTRFILLRWMGFVYLIAFYVAARQLVPLVGANGLTPAALFFIDYVRISADPSAGFMFAAFDFLVQLFGHHAASRAVDRRRAFAALLLAGYANAIDA